MENKLRQQWDESRMYAGWGLGMDLILPFEKQ